MADNRIIIDIELEDGSIAKGLLRAERQAENSGKRMGSSIETGVKRGAGTAFNGLRGTILALGAAFAGAFAGRAIIEASSRQQDAINQLNQSLKNAGDFSREASEDFQKFASDIQSTSIIGDEQILEVAALARNFTRTNEEAQKLTEAAVELSAATGNSLDSSIKNLGKTFGGLTGELGESVPALRSLTAEQLKAGEALDFVLNRFGGSAIAQTRTFSGATEQLSNTFGDLLETLGDYITRSPIVVKTINFLTKQFEEFNKAIPKGDLFGPFIQSTIDVAIFINRYILGAFDAVVQATKIVVDAVFLLGSGFSTVLTGIAKGIVDFAINPLLQLGKIAGDIAGIFNKDLGDSINNGISGIQNGLSDGVTSAFESSLTDVKASFSLLSEDVEGIFQVGGNQAAEKFLTELKTSLSSVDQSSLLPEEGDGGGNAPVVDPNAFNLVKEQQAALRGFVLANQELVSSNRGVVQELADSFGVSTAAITSTLNSGEAELASFQKGLSGLQAKIQKGSIDITNIVNNTLSKGISGGIANIVTSLQAGENAFDNFGKFILNLLGDFAIQVGQTVISIGVAALAASTSLKTLQPGPALIAGAALVAAGTLLKSLGSSGPAGASSGATVPSATQGGGGVSTGQIGNIGEDSAINLGDTEQAGRQAKIEVNIQGNVLDRRETALEIIEVLEEAKFAGIEVAV